LSQDWRGCIGVNFDPVKHEYWNDAGVRKPSVTFILAQAGLCDYSFVQEEVLAQALSRGKSVHWLLQLEDEGVLNYRSVPKALRPYRKAYLTWKRGSGFMPEQIEVPFISSHGYAGTPDRVGAFPKTLMYPQGSKAIVDFKTGAICEWVKYQLALYAVGVTEHVYQAKRLRRIALALRPDGEYRIKEFPTAHFDYDLAVALEAKKGIQCLQQ
jgi:hypothetical protein